MCAIDKNDPNYSFNMFDTTIINIIDKYCPLKKVTKKEYKQQFKPWITIGICNSIKRRDKMLEKFIKEKNVLKKQEFYVNYKNLRNTIVSLIRTSKKNHYQKYFSENSDNIRNTWKGIKSIINIHIISSSYIVS